MKTAEELRHKLNAMIIGKTCTYEQYEKALYIYQAALIRDEIDADILQKLLVIAKQK